MPFDCSDAEFKRSRNPRTNTGRFQFPSSTFAHADTTRLFDEWLAAWPAIAGLYADIADDRSDSLRYSFSILKERA